jgi:2-desacetyl-2-hydroxyethyl bacteriochlorophyllide A dehydrogenase
MPGAGYAYMGHEIVGEVTEVGQGVTRLKVGDRVVEERGRSCLALGRQPLCRQCAIGNYNLCEAPVEELRSDTVGGGWSEELVTAEGFLFPIPDELSDEQAVLIEPIGSGLRAVTRHTPQPGEKVLIIGQGTQGLGTLLSIRALQPDCHVTVLARFPYQADMARRCGADEIIMLGADLYQEAARLTGGKVYQGMFGNRMLLGGFDVVYDCVGIPSTLKDALRLARARGTVVLVGVYLEPMKIDLTPVWYWEVDLIGVFAHGAEDWQGERVDTFELIARLMREGKMKVDGLISHRFTLPEYRQAIATAIQQPRTHSIKVVFDYR